MKKKEYKFASFKGERVNQGYRYQGIPLHSLDKDQIEAYWEEFDLHRTAREINAEHGIEETDNYLFAKEVRQLSGWHLPIRGAGGERSEQTLSDKKREGSEKRPEYNYYISKFHDEIAYDREILDRVFFVNFSPQKVVVTLYRRYFDKSEKETEVFSADQIKHIGIHEMPIYHNEYDSLFFKKPLEYREYVLCLTLTEPKTCLNFYFSSFPQMLGYFPDFKTNLGGIPFQNSHASTLKERNFYFPLEKKKVDKYHSGRMALFLVICFFLCFFYFLYQNRHLFPESKRSRRYRRSDIQLVEQQYAVGQEVRDLK